MTDLKIHSDKAWEIASHWSDLLASDTRTLAAAIDAALAEARNTALEDAARKARGVVNDWPEQRQTQLGDDIIAAIRALKEAKP